MNREPVIEPQAKTNVEGKRLQLLGEYLDSQAFKDAMEKGVADYATTLDMEVPAPYLQVAFVAEAAAAKALIDTWLKDQLAEVNKSARLARLYQQNPKWGVLARSGLKRQAIV